MAFLALLPLPARNIFLCGTTKRSKRTKPFYFSFFSRPLEFSCFFLRYECTRGNGANHSEGKGRKDAMASPHRVKPARSWLPIISSVREAVTNTKTAGKEREVAVVGSRRIGIDPEAGRVQRPWRNWSPLLVHRSLDMRWQGYASMTLPVAYHSTRHYYASSSPSCSEEGGREASPASSPSFPVWEAENSEKTMLLEELLREEGNRRQEGGRWRGGVQQEPPQRPRGNDDRFPPENARNHEKKKEEVPLSKRKGGMNLEAQLFSSSSSLSSSTSSSPPPPPSPSSPACPPSWLGCHFFSSPPLLYLPNTNGGERTPRHALREQLSQDPTFVTAMQQFLNFPSDDALPSPRSTARTEEGRVTGTPPPLSPSPLSAPPQWMIVGCQSIPYLRRQLRRSQEEAYAMAMQQSSPPHHHTPPPLMSSLPSWSGSPSPYRHRFLIVHHSLQTILQLAAALLPLSSSAWTDTLPTMTTSPLTSDTGVCVPPNDPSLFAPSLRFLRCSELFFPLLHLLPPRSIDTAVFPMPVPFGSVKASYRRVLHHDLLVALHPVLRTRRTKEDARGVMVFTDSSAYAGFIVEELEASKFLVPWSRKRVSKPSSLSFSSSSSSHSWCTSFERWLPLDPPEGGTTASTTTTTTSSASSSSLKGEGEAGRASSTWSSTKAEQEEDVFLFDESEQVAEGMKRKENERNESSAEVEFPHRRDPTKAPLIVLAAAKCGETPQPMVKEWARTYSYTRQYYRSLYEEERET